MTSSRGVTSEPLGIRRAHCRLPMRSVVYESSGRRPEKVVTISDRNIIQSSLDQSRKTHCQIVEAIDVAFSISSEVIFNIGKAGVALVNLIRVGLRRVILSSYTLQPPPRPNRDRFPVLAP